MNRVGLSATLLEREPLRYTPAGVPIVALKLAHRSTQPEAGAQRTVELEIAAIAADRIALRVDRLPMGATLTVQGFLAPRRRNARALVLHLTDVEPDPNPPVSSS